MKRVCLHVSTAVSVLLIALFLMAFTNRCLVFADEDDLEFIPTGVHITPTAARGASFQPLNPGLPSDPTFTAGTFAASREAAPIAWPYRPTGTGFT
jgi:hypothetical protein